AVAGVLTLLVLLVIQDLAFGWSTTLNTAEQSYHGLIQTVATPWSWLWPAAVPSPELVDATRFFRASPDSPGTPPDQWGQWWPSVVMVWLTWLLIPRLLLLALSQWLIHRKAQNLLQRHPGMQALLYRMETPTLDTGNQHNDADVLPVTLTRTQPGELAEARHLFSWAGAGDPQLLQTLSAPDSRIFNPGGPVSLTEHAKLLP